MRSKARQRVGNDPTISRVNELFELFVGRVNQPECNSSDVRRNWQRPERQVGEYVYGPKARSPKIADHILTTFTLSLVVIRRIGSISGIPEALVKRHLSSSDDTPRHPPELT